MSDDFDPDEFLSDLGVEGDSQSPAIKQLRKKLTELGKAVKTLSTENQTLKSEQAVKAVTSVWDELNVPQPVRDFYRGEPKADDIKAWWETSKGFFNIQDADVQPTEPDGKQDLEAVQKAASLGQDQGNGHLGVEALKTSATELVKSRPSTNPTALADWLNANGFRTGAVDIAQ